MPSPLCILIVGPPILEASNAYGGGSGGYTRNMSVYLDTLGSKDLELVPYHHSVRGQRRGIANTMPVRMLVDTSSFLYTCLTKRPFAVHILAQYRGALMRELAQSLICRILYIPYGYDVKAGAFVQSFESGTRLYRLMQQGVIVMSSLLFAEGRKTQELLHSRFGRDSVYFPNFVPSSEIPGAIPERLKHDAVRLLFVGYCYRDKGVFELVEGARLAAQGGLILDLDIVGAESEEFSDWFDGLPEQGGLTVRRHGRRSHDEVLAAMQTADVYVYPTSHPGEGHNNSINEAMMHGLVILTTRQGFLGDILGGDCAYFVDRVTADNIACKLREIAMDRDNARRIANKARRRLLDDFTDTLARSRFSNAYSGLLGVDNKRSVMKAGNEKGTDHA